MAARHPDLVRDEAVDGGGEGAAPEFEDAAAASLAACPEPEPTWPAVDRRKQADRRHRPTSIFDAFFHPRRRSSGRRAEDQNQYVDVYRPSDLAMLAGIVLLNVFDAFFTLLYLSHGGEEANPIMQYLLDMSMWAFLLEKCFIVGLWVLVLVVHKNFRTARLGLRVTLTVYSVLLLYHGFVQWSLWR